MLDFFLIHAPVISGRAKRYWCGSEKTFYACYLKHCRLIGPRATPPRLQLSEDAKPISFQVFSDIRYRECIGLLAGTAFESPVWIEFETCRRRLLELALELERAKVDQKVRSDVFPFIGLE